MNWEKQPLIKGKDEITEVTTGMLKAIEQEEKQAESDRNDANRRKINFERRKIAKELGIPFISIEEEERQNALKETEDLENKTKNKIPEVWKSLAFHKANFVGTIDLEKIEKKSEADLPKETIFTSNSIDPLYEQALRILGNETVDEVYVEHLIEDFLPLYDIAEIEEDIKRVIEKEERIKRSDNTERKHLKKLATILEAILVEGITKYDWLGEKIRILAPSKFDELCRGVDAVVELSRVDTAGEFLALGIDVSFRSIRGKDFEDKIEHLLSDIDHMRLTQIKYFKDNQGQPMENLFVPKVVISIEGRSIENLVHIWEKKEEDTESFKNHTIAIDIMGQIAEQCRIFSAYARTKGLDEMATAYDDVFELLLKISEEVPRAKETLSHFEENKFVEKIQELINKRTNAQAA